MNSNRFQWPTEIPRLLWSPQKCPLCTSVEFQIAEEHPLLRLLGTKRSRYLTLPRLA
jgi:hypothetical protein